MHTDTETNPVNLTILQRRTAARERIAGPRVGDFLRLTPADDRCPDLTRFTHDWGDQLQTGGMDGSYYLTDSGYLSHSGGLDPGIKKVDVLPTNEARNGSVWFFDENISGPGRGVHFAIPCRVFVPRPGANLDGVYELSCPYFLSVWDEKSRSFHCDYNFTVTKHSMSHTAFHTRPELDAWLEQERLVIARPAAHLNPGFYHLDWKPKA